MVDLFEGDQGCLPPVVPVPRGMCQVLHRFQMIHRCHQRWRSREPYRRGSSHGSRAPRGHLDWARGRRYRAAPGSVTIGTQVRPRPGRTSAVSGAPQRTDESVLDPETDARGPCQTDPRHLRNPNPGFDSRRRLLFLISPSAAECHFAPPGLLHKLRQHLWPGAVVKYWREHPGQEDMGLADLEPGRYQHATHRKQDATSE